MGVTGYEAGFYRNVEDLVKQAERIADALTLEALAGAPLEIQERHEIRRAIAMRIIDREAKRA